MALASCSAAALAGEGRIEVVGPSVAELGSYRAREEKAVSFTLRNAGDGLLDIRRLRKSCGCATAHAGRTALQPGESTEVRVTIAANSIFGEYEERVYVESSDPRRRFTKLIVKGDAVQLVKLEPACPDNTVNLRWLALNEASCHELTLVGSVPGLRLGEPAVSGAEGVGVELASLPGADARYGLRVLLAPCSIPGPFSCQVTIPVLVPANEAPVTIEFMGELGAKLVVVPAVARLAQGGGRSSRRFCLRVLGKPPAGLTPESVQWPDVAGVSFAWDDSACSDGWWFVTDFSPDFIGTLSADGETSLRICAPNAVAATLVCRRAEEQKRRR
ncbi:MAG: DUF1573 domain-containing protein [Kiritimatiellae bacterium]|nr:DUF1573 domain-containing protein [Kiritimatiellia bacterium]